MRRANRKMAILTWFLAAIAPLCAGAQQASSASFYALFDPHYRSWIEAHPDEFSWRVFAFISQKSPLQWNVNGHSTNNALWETWADDSFTFPSKPTQTAPEWGHRLDKVTKTFQRDPLMAFLHRPSLSAPGTLHGMEANGEIASAQLMVPPDGATEEVRRNEAAFYSITNKKLWYEEGQADWFRMHPEALTFYRGSIEIKAQWAPARDGDDGHYHINLGPDGKRYKLLSIHISTNALPQWTWATWESLGYGNNTNIARCLVMGCRDTFGTDPCCVSPNDRNPAPGMLTPRLRKIFWSYGLGSQWANYRLKGSQILRGHRPAPRLLGNSNMEGQLLPTASCIGCHSRARVYPNGRSAMMCDGGVSVNPETGIETGPTDFPPPGAVKLSTGFVWALGRASPLGGEGPICGP